MCGLCRRWAVWAGFRTIVCLGTHAGYWRGCCGCRSGPWCCLPLCVPLLRRRYRWERRVGSWRESTLSLSWISGWHLPSSSPQVPTRCSLSAWRWWWGQEPGRLPSPAWLWLKWRRVQWLCLPWCYVVASALQLRWLIKGLPWLGRGWVLCQVWVQGVPWWILTGIGRSVPLPCLSCRWSVGLLASGMVLLNIPSVGSWCNNNNNNNIYLYSAIKSNHSNCSVALYKEWNTNKCTFM